MSGNKPLVEEPSLVEIEPKQVQQGQQMGAQNNPMQAQPYVGQQYFQPYSQLQGYQLNQRHQPNQGANNQLSPPQPQIYQPPPQFLPINQSDQYSPNWTELSPS